MNGGPTLQPGQKLGHYEILGQLGKGGMGEVYRAKDLKLEREVALKLLPPQVVNDREALLRFQREAKTLASLNHPSIVTIHAVEEDGGFHFLAMELVEGRTLRDSVGEGMPLAEFFAVVLPLAEALAAAHERGIIHRDLKPENLMRTDSGRLKVLDFGLARAEEGQASEVRVDGPTQALTQRGFIVGTVPYLSPEQAQGKGVDHRSDIFSFGIVCYELLAGRRPFVGESPMDIISGILRDTPASICDLREDLPDALGAILGQCLEKQAQNRLQSMREVHEALRRVQRELDEHRVLSSPRAFSAGLAFRSLPMQRLAKLLGRLQKKAALHGLLAAVMGVNLVETLFETWLRDRFGVGVALGDKLAQAAHLLEGRLSFEGHDMANPVAIYGFSIVYFFLFPLLALGTAWSLARREDASYRTFVYAVALTYLVSLPFFLFFPVPERWFWPDSGAVLLSDLWTSRLIEAFRPISGIDNCFPSFHTSLTTVVVLAAYRFRMKRRHAAACLGGAILLSTIALGIHWTTDVVAGLAAGALGFLLALRLAAPSPRLPSHARTTLAPVKLPSGHATAGAASRVSSSRSRSDAARVPFPQDPAPDSAR